MSVNDDDRAERLLPRIHLTELARAELETATPLPVGAGPVGTRVIVELLSGRFEGRVSGRLRGRSGADWIVVGPEGTGVLNVRFVIETDDGSLVYAESHGRMDLTSDPETTPALLATTFETSSASHAWLNRVVAVTRVDSSGTRLSYRMMTVVTS